MTSQKVGFSKQYQQYSEGGRIFLLANSETSSQVTQALKSR
jgi:hypothetical protein